MSELDDLRRKVRQVELTMRTIARLAEQYEDGERAAAYGLAAGWLRRDLELDDE